MRVPAPRLPWRPLGALLLASAALPTPAAALDGCIWDTRTPAPIGRIEGPSVVVDGKVYVFGGFYDQALRATDQVHVYDPSTNAWTRLADLPVPLTHAAFAVDGQTVWVVGGFQGNHPGPVIDDVFTYDVATDTWGTGPSLPAPRGSGGAARLGRNLHYYGGVTSDKETDLGDHFVLDLDNLAGGWTFAPPMPVPRNHFGSTDLGGKAYAVGGQFRHEDNPEDVDWVHAYDPVTQTWSEVAHLPYPRSHTEPGTFAMNGLLVIAGGRANTIPNPSVPDVTAYDPLTDTWRELPPMPVGLVAPVANAYGDRIFISSGGMGPVAPQVATYTRAQSAEFAGLIRINAGGAPYVSPVDAEEWCIDMGALGGQSYSNSNVFDVAGTDDDELFRSERSGTGSNPTRFGYRITVPDGLYRVRLLFAEIFWGAPGGGPLGNAQRVFDVTLEEQLVIDDLDIVAEVGPVAAYERTFDIAVSDGAIDLDLYSSVDRPKISGIEIRRLDDLAFENYCIGAPNSAGPGASLGFRGTVSVANNDLELRATGTPPSVSGLFIQGVNRVQSPLGSGFRCVGGAVFRLPPLVLTTPAGTTSRLLDFTNPPQPAGQVLPGSQWNFQLWYRDGQTSNLTDGLGIQFTP